MVDKNIQTEVVTFWESGVGKAFRAFLYAAVSALVSLGIAWLTKQSPLFAAEITPLVNYALVQVKVYLDPAVQNLPTSVK